MADGLADFGEIDEFAMMDKKNSVFKDFCVYFRSVSNVTLLSSFGSTNKLLLFWQQAPKIKQRVKIPSSNHPRAFIQSLHRKRPLLDRMKLCRFPIVFQEAKKIIRESPKG